MSNPVARVSKSTHTSEEFDVRKSAPDDRVDRRRRRAPWRQKLVEAERGLSHSFRADSALYLHIFLDSLLLATCGVLGLPATHWILVGLGLTVMLSAELFAQALERIAQQLAERVGRQVSALAAAAKLLTVLGCTSAIGIVLWLRLRELLAL
jgi:diacylglycerol kinase